MHIVFGDLHVTTKRFAKRKNKYVPIGKETEMVIEKNVLLVKNHFETYCGKFLSFDTLYDFAREHLSFLSDE